MPGRRPARHRTNRGAAIALVAALAGAAPFDAGAQAAGRVYRIGVLNEALAPNHPTVEGLKAGLRELGLAEGRDVAFEIRFTQGDPGAIRDGAAAFAKEGVDLIFTSNESPTRSAMAATATIPIVFTLVGDPVAAGIVAKLAAPQGNVTGISSLTPELAAKRLELLKTLAPAARRVWAIHQSDDRVAAAAVANATSAAAQLDLQLLARPVGSKEELARVLKEIRPGDAVLAPDRGRLDISGAVLDLSLASRVPAVFPASFYVGYGGLASYGSDYYAEGFQAARLVARILRGARPEALPVEGADKLDLAVNLKTAAALRLTVPRKILLRADTLRR
ncbi:MAG TPA: ABC transporter substrate-binding protein [Burkholderiales bacterium]|nr:ABC transporter substrate-binding protein [Burkholderiales bacterium]